MRYKFVISTISIVIIFALPVLMFAYLKYNGLEDNYTPSIIEELGENTDTVECYVHVVLGQIDSRFSSSDVCASVICDGGDCGLVVRSAGDMISAGDTALRNQAEEDILPPIEMTSGEVEDNSIEEPVKSHWLIDDSRYQYPLWQWLSIFSVAITFSTLGVSTIIISRKNTVFGLTYDNSFSSIVVLYFFASVPGILITCLFAAGLVQGALFPNFTGDELNFGFNSWSALKFRGQDWFKLAVWAYISWIL